MCDVNTGGCLYCANPASPMCATISNAINDQWIVYCDSTSGIDLEYYTNTITGGSQADETTVSSQHTVTLTTNTTSSTSSAAPTPSQSSSIFVTGPIITTSASAVCVGSACQTELSTISTSVTSTESDGANASVGAAGNLSEPANSKKHSTTLIAAVCGGVAAIALICAGGWYTRKNWARLFSHTRSSNVTQDLDEKKDNNLPEMHSSSGEDGIAEAAGSTPLPAKEYLSPAQSSEQPELDSVSVSSPLPSGVGEGSATGLGIKGGVQSRYTPTISDPPSAVELENNTPAMVMQPRKPEYNPADEHQLPVSPPLSGSTDVPYATGSALDSEAAISPVTPVYKAYTPYTPSHYGNELPSSLPRTIRQVPPSLPQEYSAVSLGSMADIYRGPGNGPEEGLVKGTASLQSSIYQGLNWSRGEGAPWAYLSAENARTGGWRNDDTQ